MKNAFMHMEHDPISAEHGGWPIEHRTCNRVMVVDDDPDFCRLMQRRLENADYQVSTVTSGQEALAKLEDLRPDLILLDVVMPGMDGFETAQHLKEDTRWAGIPVIMLTVLGDQNARLNGLEAGVEEFLTKPVDHVELTVRVRNLLRLKSYQDFLERHNEILDQQVRRNTAQVRAHFIDTVLTLTRTAEYRDEATGTHVSRISHYCALLAEHLGADPTFCDQIFYASPMHDIGKLAIPDLVLLKPGKFEASEWRIMQTHTTIGAQILQGNQSPYLRMGAEIARSHHENWDGSGYPDALRGDAIPLSARLMAICDVYDALRSQRPYKQPMSHHQALEIIRKGDDRIGPGKFDPMVLDAFFAEAGRFATIYGELSPTGEPEKPG